MSNFGFLKEKSEYITFGPAAIEAERVYATSPAMCAIGCRKALELAVKWVYAADGEIEMPYKNNLSALIHEDTFRYAVDETTWTKLPFIVKLGNLAVHTTQNITRSDALTSLRALFEFIDWIDCCYGTTYEVRHFEESAIPAERVRIDTEKIREQESLLDEKDAEIESLLKKIEDMSAAFAAQKEHNRTSRKFEPEELTEYQTRKIYIDVDLKELGWSFDGPEQDIWIEYPVEGMGGVIGQQGFVDYVLFGKDGLPLAVIEAKRTSKDPNIGRTQAKLYADCLENKFGRRPMMFTTNGFETYFWDDLTGPQRKVSGLFSRDDLQKLMNRRADRKPLEEIRISEAITGRYYQMEAIRAVCERVQKGFRKNLLVMATGTGKTRTACSLTDVLSRGGYVTNILFLADRTALVKQARDAFKQFLPDMPLCNLCSNKDDRSARIVFSTYPTMLNAIDTCKSGDGRRIFTPAHFDLIIVDESHRSIFKKYKAIFDYFDALLVGLTATPKNDVDRNTYDFFEMESEVPTYAYDYETAVVQDHVLVPFYNYEVKTKFLEEGIKYDDLSEEDKKRYEEDFVEDDYLPDFIPSESLNKFIFNEITVDTVLQDLMERGIKINGGDLIGKTIIFAQNKRHAEFILERFNHLYPQHKGTFAQRVVCDDTYVQTIIDAFKVPEKQPQIAVSVDMMDTGIDVPECVNLVFFKKVRSKTKFWQMIGRGTRLAPDLECTDQIDGAYTGKRRFLIFDYCGNFEFFREKPNGFDGKEAKTLTENIFGKKIRLAVALQDAAFAKEDFQGWRNEIVQDCHSQVTALNKELFSVKLVLQYVEKYRKEEAWTFISDGDKGELINYLAPIVYLDDPDEYAKRFDNFMYGMMIAMLEQMPSFSHAKEQLCATAVALERKVIIPQIKEKLEEIRQINTDDYWAANNPLLFEQTRKDLRDLIKFLVDSGDKKPIIKTRLHDPVIESSEDVPIDQGFTFEDYKKKVNRYVEENGNTLAIYKLTHNIQLTQGDYQELERVLTEELGSREDYQREYGDTPFGLLIRKIAKLDHQAAMEAFSMFINDASLNRNQIAFVHKVISYIEANGYMENISQLLSPPFDKPITFVKLFDKKTQDALISTIRLIKDNAIEISA